MGILSTRSNSWIVQYVGVSTESPMFCRPALCVDLFHGQAGGSVLRSFTGHVLGEPLLEIVGLSDVVGTIGEEEDVDVNCHLPTMGH